MITKGFPMGSDGSYWMKNTASLFEKTSGTVSPRLYPQSKDIQLDSFSRSNGMTAISKVDLNPKYGMVEKGAYKHLRA